MEAESLRRLDLCSAALIRHYGRKRTKRNGTSQAYGTLIFRSLVIHAAESTTIALACKQTGRRCSMSPLSSTRQSRSMAIRPTGLSLDLVRVAKKAGCRISLGTDAHDPLQLRFMEYSIAGRHQERSHLEPDDCRGINEAVADDPIQVLERHFKQTSPRDHCPA